MPGHFSWVELIASGSDNSSQGRKARPENRLGQWQLELTEEERKNRLVDACRPWNEDEDGDDEGEDKDKAEGECESESEGQSRGEALECSAMEEERHSQLEEQLWKREEETISQ